MTCMMSFLLDQAQYHDPLVGIIAMILMMGAIALLPAIVLGTRGFARDARAWYEAVLDARACAKIEKLDPHQRFEYVPASQIGTRLTLAGIPREQSRRAA